MPKPFWKTSVKGTVIGSTNAATTALVSSQTQAGQVQAAQAAAGLAAVSPSLQPFPVEIGANSSPAVTASNQPSLGAIESLGAVNLKQDAQPAVTGVRVSASSATANQAGQAANAAAIQTALNALQTDAGLVAAPVVASLVASTNEPVAGNVASAPNLSSPATTAVETAARGGGAQRPIPSQQLPIAQAAKQSSLVGAQQAGPSQSQNAHLDSASAPTLPTVQPTNSVSTSAGQTFAAEATTIQTGAKQVGSEHGSSAVTSVGATLAATGTSGIGPSALNQGGNGQTNSGQPGFGGSNSEAGSQNQGDTLDNRSAGPVPPGLLTTDSSQASAALTAGTTSISAHQTQGASLTTNATPGLTTGERVQVYKQVADRMELLAAAKPVDGITVQLQPHGLGDVTIVVKTLGKELEATLSASNSSVRAALSDGKDDLSQAMAGKGFHLTQVNVAAQATGAGGHPNNQQGGQANHFDKGRPQAPQNPASQNQASQNQQNAKGNGGQRAPVSNPNSLNSVSSAVGDGPRPLGSSTSQGVDYRI